ncbi:hypothetical protein [Dactylosporangium sp. CS-033363]|uniref:hypothetical protein n=1 Tax=Dactylosporangium sp. CS-033363 TaxID=3239935 RepID=UPI003D8FE09F
MKSDGRVLSPAVLAALTDWPSIGQHPERADLTPLIPFLNELLDDLPWWNPDSRTRIRSARCCTP